MTWTRFDRRDVGQAEATAARRWDATFIRMVVLSRSITAQDVAATKAVVVVEAQEATVVETAILHPETVVAIQPRPQTGCHLPLEQRASVAVCRHHHHPLISAMAVDTVDTGAGTTRAMAMEADMVRRQGSITESVVEVVVIKAIKARGTNNRRILVVMTVDKEVMEGIEATIVATVAMVVAIATRSGCMFKAPLPTLCGCDPKKAPNGSIYRAHGAVYLSRR